MPDGSRQLKGIWKREWDYQKQELLIHMSVEIGLLFSLFVIYELKSEWLFKVFSYIKTLPPVLYAFAGFPEELPNGSLLTFIRLLMMWLYVWLAWSFGARGLESIWREEEDNNIYLICNQWCDRFRLGIYKYTWSAVSMLATYFVLFFFSIFFLVIGSANRELLFQNVMAMLCWMVRGCFSLLLLLSICVSYAMCCRYREQTMWVYFVVFGTLIVGNLYKVRDLICWILEQLRINSDGLRNLLGGLDVLYWFSPLSWLNPFSGSETLQITTQFIICIIITSLFMLAGIFRYRTRELGW